LPHGRGAHLLELGALAYNGKRSIPPGKESDERGISVNDRVSSCRFGTRRDGLYSLCCSLLVAACGGLVFSIPASPVRADDVIVLKHGGRIEGEWLNRNERDPRVYEIKTRAGGRITLSAADIARVETTSDVMRQYEQKLADMPDTLDGHWEMAEWCRKQELKTQREFHLRKVLQFDPNHEAARRALGYTRVKGKWVQPDQWMEKQGYIRHKGSWKLPQEVELEARKERIEQNQKQWRIRIRRWRGVIIKGRKENAEALNQLRAIAEPAAIPGLAELLTDPKEPTPLKRVYVEVLGRFSVAPALDALIRCAVFDKDSELRERCIDQIKHHDTDYAITALTRMLHDKDNQVVNRAARVIGRLDNPKAVPRLIDALVTKHRFKLSSGGGNGYNVGFGPGGSGMSTGGSTKVVEKPLQNKDVLDALTRLAPAGINYRYDQQAWKNWYSRRELVGVTTLRRDP